MQRILLASLTALLLGLLISTPSAVGEGQPASSKALATLAQDVIPLAPSLLDADTEGDDDELPSRAVLAAWTLPAPGAQPAVATHVQHPYALPPARAPPHHL